MTNLSMSNGSNKILIASISRKVFSFEYVSTEGFLKPTVREVTFTYIPSAAEIISIDAFNKSCANDDFVIGITIIKPSSDHKTETYFNIYSEWEPSAVFNLESVSQNCLILELDFIPYQLYHTTVLLNGDIEYSKEVVWLLSGSDDRIHIFREDRVNHCYSEVKIEDYFPELMLPPSIVLWMDIQYNSDFTQRVSAYGCECGFMKLSIVNPMHNEILSYWTMEFDGSISSLCLFNLESKLKRPEFVQGKENGNEPKPSSINLLVANTSQSSFVFMDVARCGLSNLHRLQGSREFDAVLCSSVADVDMDNNKEILLGTYGQELLIYKYVNKLWVLYGQRTFANPIHSLMYVDVTGDGVRELVILSLRGVHILQHDPELVSKILAERFQNFSTLFRKKSNAIKE